MSITAAAFVAAFFGGLGVTEILIILLIVILLFGASRIPEVARSLGRGVDEFKKGLRGEANRDELPADQGRQKELPPPSDEAKASAPPQAIEEKKEA